MTASPHASDCAVHNGPALPAGPCDCGAERREQVARIINEGADGTMAGVYRRADAIEALYAGALSAEAALAEAVEVLRPFASECAEGSLFDPTDCGQMRIFTDAKLDVAAFRRARAFVEKHGRKG